MPILIFKTDLDSVQRLNSICPILDLHPSIINWSVDQEDVDNVLRIEALNDISESDIIVLLAQFNIISETLED